MAEYRLVYPEVANFGSVQSSGGKGEAVTVLPRTLDNKGFGLVRCSCGRYKNGKKGR